MNFLLIDKETRSRADLPATGQHIYARHPSTEVMCMGWKMIGERETHMLKMPHIYTDADTAEFKYAVKHADFVVAHNAPFEQAMWRHCLLPTTALGADLPELPPEKWICTLSLCSILGLPRGLEKACIALGLEVRKDMEGKKLLLQMCKPRRPIQNIGKWIEWVEDDPALQRLYSYCETDLWAEEGLFTKLRPYSPFTQKERDLWVLDQKINQRGFRVDIELVDKILELIKQEENELTAQLRLKTFGWVKTAKSTKPFRDFLLSQGVMLPNLQKKTVDDALKEIEDNKRVANQDVIDVLKIRQSLGKSSTSKYEAFKNRCDDLDMRVRDNLLFHGASTGRWAGTGVQPQNFPRGTVKVPPYAYSDVLRADLDEVRMFYGRPMDLFSSMLRGMIVATPGKEIFCGDFSSIEARVLLWVAGDKAGVREYEDGLDTYCTMAGTVYGCDWRDVLAEYKREGYSERRQMGKKVILACGYQMGLKKFEQTCIDEGLKVPQSIILRAHAAFREKYPLVPRVWDNYERAAIFAALNPGKRVTVNKVTWFIEGEFLFARLPSGRKLAYYKPEVRNEGTPWGDIRPKLYVWTVDSKTKQWVQRAVYGGLLTENIVQAISRDCMAESMTRLEAAGYEVLTSIHDEIPAERNVGEGSLDEFIELMSVRPEWGLDIPLKVGGWNGPRYRKG